METRSDKRDKISLKVNCQICEESGQSLKLACGNKFETNAVDISRSGIGLISKYLLPKGAILELEIDGKLFDLNEAMKIKSEIVHYKFIKDIGYQCGLRFIEISDTYQKAIEKFIAKNERRQSQRLDLQ